MSVGSFAVIGSDKRQDYVAAFLKEDGFSVERAFAGRREMSLAASSADCVVLPLLTKNAGVDLTEVFAVAKKDALIFAGLVGEHEKEQAKQYRREILDYLAREDLQILNAVPTAEGALAVAIQKLPVTVFGSRCLITGFGRVAKRLALLLLASGASVTVAARKSADLAFAKSVGARAFPISLLDKRPLDYDILFNTIPEKIITADALKNLPQGCVVADLASAPGGVDFDAAERLGITASAELSLPGRVAPKTAAEYIKETIILMLEERGVAP